MRFLLAQTSIFLRPIWVGILPFSTPVTPPNMTLSRNLLRMHSVIVSCHDDKAQCCRPQYLPMSYCTHCQLRLSATTVPSSLHLSNLLHFLNVPDSFLELTTTTKKPQRDPNRWNVHWFSNFCSFLSHLLIACEGNVTAWDLHKLLPAGKALLGNSWFCAFWDLALIGSLLLVRKWTLVCFVPHLSEL